MNLREQILATTLKSEPVTIPRWNATLVVWEMDSRQRVDFASAMEKRKEEDDNAAFAAELLVRTVRDEAGHLVFTLADVEALTKQPGQAVEDLASAAARVNGLDVASKEQRLGK